MANSLSLTSSNNNAGIFECPNCKQTIDASSTQCRFCSAAIDPVAAEAAAEKMSKVNQACSDASFLRTMAISIFVFLGLIFVPFLTWLGMLGSYFSHWPYRSCQSAGGSNSTPSASTTGISTAQRPL
jgi:hypothetical protein